MQSTTNVGAWRCWSFQQYRKVFFFFFVFFFRFYPRIVPLWVKRPCQTSHQGIHCLRPAVNTFSTISIQNWWPAHPISCSVCFQPRVCLDAQERCQFILSCKRFRLRHFGSLEVYPHGLYTYVFVLSVSHTQTALTHRHAQTQGQLPWNV